MFYKIRDFIRKHFIGYRPSDMPCLDYLDYLESKGEGTMKVIDLLNKIANGEEVPKKIRFDNINWNKVYGEKYMYYMDDYDNDFFLYFFRKNLDFTLNDEVEIIEEDKKIEKLLMIDGTANILLTVNQTRRKINEIIDKLNKEE